MAEREPDVAVVIVNYNAGEHLLRCLSSVFASAEDAALEVFVIDNASHDGSAEAAKREHPDVTLIENPDNRGLSAGLNQGIRWSRAPDLLLMNPDAEITSGTIGGLAKLAADRPRVGAVGPLIRNPDGTVYPSGRRIPTIAEAVGHAFIGPFVPDNPFSRRYMMSDWDRATERQVAWVSLSCMLVRRAALDRIGLLDEGFFLYGEELDLCTRLRDAGWSVLFTPEVEVVHVGGVSTGRSRRMLRLHSRSIYRYFRKHRAKGLRVLLLPLAWMALRLRAEIAARKGLR